jgi:RNA-directed DNA polymerase
VVINIDLAGFFPSISAERVRKAFQAHGWNKQVATLLTNICTHEGQLPQGAPTSPALSNLICRRLDTRLASLAAKLGGQFTRYADDITLSFPRFGGSTHHEPKESSRSHARTVSRKVLATVKAIIEEEGFKIQWKKKVRAQRAHQQQTATGLVVNNKVDLPRAVRRRIRAMQHGERKGTLGTKEKQRLRGWESVLAMVAHQRGG